MSLTFPINYINDILSSESERDKIMKMERGNGISFTIDLLVTQGKKKFVMQREHCTPIECRGEGGGHILCCS